MKCSSYQIGELFEQIRNGLTVENDPKSGGLPITRIETITNGEINLVRVGYSGIEAGDKDGWLLEEGDILFSHINSLSHIGKCAIYKTVPEKLIHGMNLLSFRAKKEILLPEYALYLFRSNTFKSKLAKSIKPSVNQASVGIKDIQKIPVDIPPLATQKHIARVLEQADQLRKQAQQMESELKQLAQSLFVEMFGDPVRNPKGWDRKPLSDVAKLARGRFSARPRNDPQFYGGPYPFIQTGTVVASDTFITTHEQTLNDKGLAVSKIFPPGTIAITIAANIGATAILTYPTCFPDSVVGITAGSELGVEFLEYQLRFFKQQLDSDATETAQKNINLQVLEPLMVIVPPRKKQEKFMVAYKLIHEQLTFVCNTKLEAENGFNSLMQRAFNGELTAPERKAA